MNAIYHDIISYAFNFPKQSLTKIAKGTQRNYDQVRRTLQRLQQCGWVTEKHEVTEAGMEAAIENKPSPLDPKIVRNTDRTVDL